MERQLAFGLYHNGNNFCIIKSVLSEDTKYLVEILPKNKKIFMFFNISWDYEDKSKLKEWAECLKQDNIVYYLLSNDQRQYDEFEALGFPQILVNQNCFIDYNLFKDTKEQRIYNLVVNARLSSFKRHELLDKINDHMTIISYSHSGVFKDYRDKFLAEKKETQIIAEDKTEHQVLAILSQSKIGAILSEREGACYASTEYLFSGLPVLSTQSTGGRDIWYNEDNSIICEPTKDGVYEANDRLQPLVLPFHFWYYMVWK